MEGTLRCIWWLTGGFSSRGIGKRNRRLRVKAQQAAARIQQIDSPAARWIAGDALREFRRVLPKG